MTRRIDMDRRDRILEHIRRGMRGIEIGPHHAPLLPKAEGWNVLALDAQDAESLRRRAARDTAITAEGIARIEQVDLLGPAHRLADLAAARGHPSGSFDFVVSSLNFEHLPHPLLFLLAVQQVLKPGGGRAMAVPNKRCCFDLLRPRSPLDEILEAHFERREQPTFRQQFDSLADVVTLVPGAPAAPGGGDALRGGQEREGLHELLAAWLGPLAAGSMPYRDAHFWTFTHASAERILRDLSFHGLITHGLLSCSATSGNELYLRLRHVPGALAMSRTDHYEHKRQVLRRIAQEENVYGWLAAGARPAAPGPAG